MTPQEEVRTLDRPRLTLRAEGHDRDPLEYSPPMEPVRVRQATPGDADQLRTFRCASGPWYEAEVETFVQGVLADHVAQGFGALVIEDAGEVVALLAVIPQPFPGGGEGTVIELAAGAVRIDRQGTGAHGSSLSGSLVSAAVDEARASGHVGCYAKVALENVRVRRVLERAGFRAGPVVSDPRYAFYTLNLRA